MWKISAKLQWSNPQLWCQIQVVQAKSGNFRPISCCISERVQYTYIIIIIIIIIPRQFLTRRNIGCHYKGVHRHSDWMMKRSLLFGQIVPVAGPSAGGTKVTVTGENLGVGVTDTYITVGGQECIINHVDPFIRWVFLSSNSYTTIQWLFFNCAALC